MGRVGKADREHSGHYLSAVTVVTVAVAGMAWLSQNRTLAAAAAALGLYALHLLSIRFLLENQRRQRQVLDAQWEVLQRFINSAESESAELEDLVPPMPADMEAPEDEDARSTAEHMVLGDVVPPAESLGEDDSVFAIVVEEDSIEPLSAIPDLEMVKVLDATGREGPDEESERPQDAEVPVPRHFAFGTVALVRDLMTPAEVARVLLEQRRQPGKKFGVLAVEMGLLTESQREELLLAQQEGLFTDAEMRDARLRLREFRETAAHSMAGLD